MPGRAFDHAGESPGLSVSRLPHESMDPIVEAAKRARCSVKVIMSSPDGNIARKAGLGSGADVRILVIPENFQIKEPMIADDGVLGEMPLLAYLAEYDEVSELLALRAGFADVLHPGMSARILSERIMAAWNRSRGPGTRTEAESPSQTEQTRPFELDLVNRVFAIEGRRVSLSKMEVQLLQVLSTNYHRPVSREEIHATISANSRYDSRTIDSHIKRLRRKFVDAGVSQDIIKTIYGLGYRIGTFA